MPAQAGVTRPACAYCGDLNSAATLRLGLMLAEMRALVGLAFASQAGASSRCGGW